MLAYGAYGSLVSNVGHLWYRHLHVITNRTFRLGTYPMIGAKLCADCFIFNPIHVSALISWTHLATMKPVQVRPSKSARCVPLLYRAHCSASAKAHADAGTRRPPRPLHCGGATVVRHKGTSPLWCAQWVLSSSRRLCSTTPCIHAQRVACRSCQASSSRTSYRWWQLVRFLQPGPPNPTLLSLGNSRGKVPCHILAPSFCVARSTSGPK